VLAKGRLYLTSAEQTDGATTTLHALCFDAKDGRTLWDTEVFQPDPTAAAKMHRKNSAASPTPIVTDDRLYVHFGHMGTAALDLDGKVVWKQNSLAYPPVHGTGGSPILVDGTLVFSCDGQSDPFVAALDAKSGEVRWKTPRNTTAKKTFSFSTPLAMKRDGKTVIISPGSGFVGAYNLADGKEIWRVPYGEGYSVVPRPVLAHDLLFVSSSFDKPTLYAIKPDGSNVAWTIPKAAPHTASTVVVGDNIFFVSDAGIATCANAKTGEIHWSERIGGNYSASPVATDDRIYFLNETGTCTVVEAAPTFTIIAKNDLGEPTLASPAAADGALYIRSEKHLWRIGSRP
jgi:outer membrane protein assembly factor BamB